MPQTIAISHWPDKCVLAGIAQSRNQGMILRHLARDPWNPPFPPPRKGTTLLTLLGSLIRGWKELRLEFRID